MAFIKLDRKLLSWEWIDEPNTVALWIIILLNANYESKSWHGITIEKGQFVTSVAKLKKMSGLSVRSVRTSLERLKSTNEIAIQTTSLYTLITVNNWALYQCNDTSSDNVNGKVNNKRTTNKRQTNDKRTTTTKEYKEYKEYKEVNKKNIYGTYKHVTLTDEELSKLVRDYGDLETQEAINYLDEYIEMKGTKYKSCYLAMKKWVFSAVKQKQGKKEYRDVLPEYYTIDNTNTKSNVDVDKEKLKEMLKSIGEHNG